MAQSLHHNKTMKNLILLILLFIALHGKTFAQNQINAEFGMVENSYNQVQIPGDDGTRFNMRKSLPSEDFYFRLDYKKFFNNKHGLRLLYAPLKQTGEHTYGKDIQFNGEVFSANNETKTLYKFNSYRATYFYQLVQEEKWKLNIGVTGKIRDAEIELKQGSTKKSRSDFGFVPLFYLWSEYWLTNETKLTFDFDGLAAPQGRAFDMALMIGHRLSPSVTANLGYRMLEGGVDNDKVYNFSQFNFYFASVEANF